MYPNSKVWWYDFRFRKRRYRASTKTQSKTLAREIERAVRRQCEEGSYEIKRVQAARTFGQAGQEYLDKRPLDVAKGTVQISENNLKHLVPVFGNKTIEEITELDFKRYQQDRISAGAAPRTINMELETFRGVLKQSDRWDALQGKIRKLVESEHVGLALEPSQEIDLLWECSTSSSRSLAPVVKLALSTGMRSKESKQLRWHMIDFKAATLRVGVSKTSYGTKRIIPLNERAMACLEEWAAQFPDRQPNHFVFPSERVKRGPNQTIKYVTNPLKPMGSWKTAWRSAKKRAGVTCRFHDLRHTAVTRMLEAGVPYQVVASLLGWSATTMADMVKVYGHIGQESFKNAVSFLNGSEPEQKRKGPSPDSAVPKKQSIPVPKQKRNQKPEKKTT